MDNRTSPEATYGQPVFSVAGAMPSTSNAPWKTAYPNPDAGTTPVRSASHGPCFSIAGVIPSRPEVAWRTSNPDPTRDVLDVSGHVITRVEAAARAELAAETRVRLAHRRSALTVRASETRAIQPAA
ncbi:MAG: hypothetical protein ACR2KK_07445 [Acidimicrobiales bacterium]